MDTLLDVIEIFIPGDWGNEEYTQDAPNEVICIRGADIENVKSGIFQNIPRRYVSNSSINKKTLVKGDIIIEKSGGSPTQSTGRVCYISDEFIKSKRNIVCSNFCAAFRLKSNWYYKYIYYYLQNIYNQGNFFNYEGKTSGIRNLLLETAFQAISLPNILTDVQKITVKILDKIDQKINLNTRMNAELEAMAKQLYDYWFVQFDFPDENGKPYKSSGGKMVYNEKLKREIPEGWDVKRIGDYANIFTGKKDVSKVTPGDYLFFSCAPDPITSNDYIYDGEVVLVSGNGSYTGRTTYYKGKCDLYQRTYACVLKEKYDNYYPWFYQYMKNYFEPHYSGGKHGSAIPYIILSDLTDSIIVSRNDIIKLYSEKVRSIFNQIYVNHYQIIPELTQLRDSLLPMLMNGQED